MAVMRFYNPEEELLDKYQTRTTKQAKAWQVLGQPLGEGELEFMLEPSMNQIFLNRQEATQNDSFDC